MSDVEAIGDVVTGGLLARAVEPEASGPGADGRTQESDCLNCGTHLAGPFCHACGQKSHVRRSLRGFVLDMVQGLFNFEGKIWRTLPMLAWRPGELTRRYINGERARFVSPVALYLFTVFLMFAVLNFTGALDSGSSGGIQANFSEAVSAQQAKISRTEKQRADAIAAQTPVVDLDRKLAEQKNDLAQIERLQQGEFPVKVDVDDVDETPQWVRGVIEKAQEDPELLVTNIQDAASKFSWLLIPLSVPFMWLLFPFSRRFHLYDHTVFVTYSLSFIMMLAIVGGMLVAVGWTALAGFLFFVPPIHMYRQLKGGYCLSRFGALWRTILLTVFAILAALLFFILIAGLGMSD